MSPMKQHMSWLRQQRQRLAEQGLRRRLKALVRKCLAALVRPMARFFDNHPRVRQHVIRLLDRLGLRPWLKKLLGPSAPVKKIVLSPRARAIRRELQQALGKHRES